MSRSPQVYFSFDFGTKRIGMAVGQTITKTANALTTLSVNNGQIPWSNLQSLIEQWHPDAFIVGLPLNKDGTPHTITEKAQAFGRRLGARFQLPVHFMDERLSSIEAEQLLGQGNASKNKGDIDKLAAKLILESWFNQSGSV